MSHDFQGPMIRVVDLVTHYGERRILNHVNLEVEAGETMVIVGGSGTGKSTLLRHIIRLEMPTSGHVYIKNHDICSMPEDRFNLLRAQMGMLFQSAALFSSMTIEENVSLPLRELTHLEDSTIRIMTRIKLEMVGLSGFENYMPAQLSGGMKKRAGLARAMAMDPQILLFDEPSAGLDPITAAGIDTLILKLRRAYEKMSIVVVTHEMASAFMIADRIAVMDQGEVIAVGTPEEIRANQHPRVQQLLNRTPDDETKDAQAYLRALTQPTS
jgi:phospholipid/cholesterol/gamma-HCH transport system ATP-binding protein